MKKLVLLILLFNFTSTISAEEKSCGKFDIGCKTSKFLKETLEFQKKGISDSKKQLKGTLKTIREQ